MGTKLAAVVSMIALFVMIYSPAAAAGQRSSNPTLDGSIAVGCGATASADLIAAIDSANANPDSDTIALAANCTYTFSEGPYTSTQLRGPNALPVITTPVTINGHGATIQRSLAQDTPFFRLFQVDPGGELTLNHLTIQYGAVLDPGITYNSYGGGILNYGGTLTVNDCQFLNNTATYSGGGICNLGTSETTAILNVTNSTFTLNVTLQEGGAIFSNDSLTVSKTNFNTNSAQNGGAVSNSGTGVIANSTFFLNAGGSDTGNSGAGAISNIGTLTLANSTLANNSSINGAGGIQATFFTLLQNTIIANNLGGNCADEATGAFSDGGGNLAWGDVDNAPCPGVAADPKLATSLGDNGGPTQTLALLAGSAAIDAGDYAICSAAPVGSRDQRGYIRPNGAHCDSGAYEAGAKPEKLFYLPIAVKN